MARLSPSDPPEPRGAGTSPPSSGRTPPGKIAQPLARHQNLAEDFTGSEIAHQRLRAGVAERAGQRASHLGAHAQRAAVVLGDVDGLDLDRRQVRVQRIAEAKQPFARAVDRDLLADDLRPVEQEMVAQRLPDPLLDVAHPLEIGDAVDVDPVPQLARAHLRLALVEADAAERRPHLRLAQPDKRAPPRRRGAHGGTRVIEVEGDAHGQSGIWAARDNIMRVSAQRSPSLHCHSRAGGNPGAATPVDVAPGFPPARE